jgi:predicted transcriptional regulator
MLPAMLEHDRKQAGWSVGQAAWRLGVTVREYRELEAGARSPSFETWDRIWSAGRRRSLGRLVNPQPAID